MSTEANPTTNRKRISGTTRIAIKTVTPDWFFIRQSKDRTAFLKLLRYIAENPETTKLTKVKVDALIAPYDLVKITYTLTS